jgi:hypothetical protein
VMLRDLHNSPSSKILTVRTPAGRDVWVYSLWYKMALKLLETFFASEDTLSSLWDF